MATIEVHWGPTTCPECKETFDGVSVDDSEQFELHHEFECPCCGTIIERDITLAGETIGHPGRESGGNTVPVTDGVKGIIGGPRPGPNCHLWSD